MKRLFLFTLAAVYINLCFAQESKLVRQLGVIFSNEDQIGFMFKFGDDNERWRLYASSVGDDEILHNVNSLNYSRSIDELSLAFGKEFLKDIDSRSYLT